jgi:hypothetical protein
VCNLTDHIIPQQTHTRSMTWEEVKKLLKIDIKQRETDNHYEFNVYIPSFDSRARMTISKKDYYHEWVWYDATPEDTISWMVVKSFKLEDWLGVNIIDYRKNIKLT